MTLREHIVKEVRKMETRYIGEIGKLSEVIENFAVRYNTETTNAYDTLNLRESVVNKENVILNLTHKYKGKIVINNTEESEVPNSSDANFKTITKIPDSSKSCSEDPPPPPIPASNRDSKD